MIKIKGIIMAGGKGTRLRPLTCSLPKPMVPILNKPVMEYTVELLKKYNITDIAVTTAYLPDIIADYFKEGDNWGVKLTYFMEEQPLGTGGSVRNAEAFIEDTFLVISGDALTDLNIQEAIDFHRSKGSKVTLVLKKESVPIEYGVVITNEEGRIVRFLEKPSWGEVFSNTVNTGIYIIEAEVMKYYAKGDNFDFSKDLFPQLLKDEIPMYGYVTEDYWCDIGDLSSYKDTQMDILNNKVKIEISGEKIADGVWIGEGTRIHDDTVVTPPVYIGKNSSIAPCEIGPYSVISDNCSIERDTSIKKSIIWKDVRIGEGTHVRGSVICNGVDIGNRGNIFENTAIGEKSSIADAAMIKPDIKIWPYKKIEENTVINKNLIWASKASKGIFGYKDISGHLNINITPEFSIGLGSAFASIMKGGTIIVSDDNSNSANIIKNSVMTGILSSGGQVIELKDTVMAVNRYATKYYKADGGVHIKTDSKDKNKIYLEFIDGSGGNISRNQEREMENLINRGDYERCNADRIKPLTKVEGFDSLFIKEGINILSNINEIRRRNFTIGIDSDSQKHLDLARELLTQLGCKVKANPVRDKKLEDRLYYLSSQVIFNRANFGVLISNNGEELILIDEKGKVIQKEKYQLLAALIAIKMQQKGPIVLPYVAPSCFEKTAHEYGVKVVRTKSNPSSVMQEMLKANAVEEKFPIQYILNYNAIWAIGLLVNLLAIKDTRIAEIVDEFPSYHYLQQVIPCDWQDKGRVIKELIEENKNQDIELFEGVKINNDKGWALITPDHEKPLFKIYTEGWTEEYAQELSVAFTDKVKKLINKHS